MIDEALRPAECSKRRGDRCRDCDVDLRVSGSVRKRRKPGCKDTCHRRGWGRTPAGAGAYGARCSINDGILTVDIGYVLYGSSGN